MTDPDRPAFHRAALFALAAAPLALLARPARAQEATAAHSPDDSASAAKPAEPFAFADFTWLQGNPRQHKPVFDFPAFTGEIRADVNYVYDFNHPKDHTLVGSSELGRVQEFQVQQFGAGGDFHYHNVRARLMTQFGAYSTMTPRNDASPARGQWRLDDSYRYLSEIYGGYHLDKLHGVNLDAGLFMSYVGLFGYYQYDNWAYQPSYVSSNTPWFFEGLRIQTFPSDKLKLEYWIVNGWQSYGMFNESPGVGVQVLWRPTGNWSILSNNYHGKDTPGNPSRKRFHTDNSVQWKYRDHPAGFLSKAALSLTVDAGCEWGGGVRCSGGTAAEPAQYFLGFMLYHRWWFLKDRYAVTLGGGAIDNPGRYLVLVPPVNGATAATGTPYFSAAPGDEYRAWDASLTFDFMPVEEATFRWEFNHRAANVPYFAGAGGVTPPGGNTGTPSVPVGGWAPDLRKSENRMTFALLVKF